MILSFLKKLFGTKVDPKTERVVNIVWKKEEWWREGFDTNSVFRVINHKHELDLLRDDSEFIIETCAAVATPLTCPLNKFHHEHGCYSAGDEI